MLQGLVCRRIGLVAAGLLLCLLGDVRQAHAAEAEARTGHRLLGRPAGKPAYLWLWYADGGAVPVSGEICAGSRIPAFTPSSGVLLDDWKRQVQAYLDLWYADFNILFTLTKPPTGDFYAIIITSDSTWCRGYTKRDGSIEAGIAPFNCNDNIGEVGYALQCAASPHSCANTIAHEHGHLVGLEHTNSTVDIMNQTILDTTAGFENQSNHTDAGMCRPLQNSYQQMLVAFGPWPGGTKTSPLPKPDGGTDAADASPAVAIDAPKTGTPMGNLPPLNEGDGGFAVLPGFDPLSRPPLPVVDAAPLAAPSKASGCDLLLAGRSRSSAWWIALLALVITQRLRSSVTAARDRSSRRS